VQWGWLSVCVEEGEAQRSIGLRMERRGPVGSARGLT
jgi:hypothetical protein